MKEKIKEEHEIKVRLYNIDERTAIEKREAIYMVPVKKLTKIGNLVKIAISDNPPCAGKRDERQAFESHPDPNFWRWTAGGAAIVIRSLDPNDDSGYAYSLLALLRDAGAITYANHTTLSTGLGCSLDEIKLPILTIREAFEELIIKTPDGIICPFLKDDVLNKKIDIKSIVKIGMELREETKNFSLVKTPASILRDLPGEREIEVFWRGETSTCYGLWIEDRGVHGLDVVQIITIDLCHELKDLQIFDGEIIGKKNLLNRKIYAYELQKNLNPTGKIIAGWTSGKYFTPVKDAAFPPTPVLKFVLEQLKTRGNI
ncbi:MAG: hypothetical protein WA063_05870 [Minisyncoccia bacterium]